MRLLDERYTRTPYYGIWRTTAWLRAAGYQVNHKRVARLLRRMGSQAIYPKPRLGDSPNKLYSHPKATCEPSWGSFISASDLGLSVNLRRLSDL
jgi:hypothetical protein